MNLRDGVLRVRNVVGELTPWLFSDNDIVRDLNYSARSMCSYAQALRTTYAGITDAPTTVNGVQQGVQEYYLPGDLEQIIQCKVQIGILYPINIQPQEMLQVGGYVSATPFAGYIRRGTLLTGQIPAQQVSEGTEQVYAPAGDTSGAARWILGFYPVPSAAYPFFVDYFNYHPQMVAPLDLCLLPDTGEYFDAWTAYAEAKCFEKRGDIPNADRKILIHRAGKEELKQYMLNLNAQVNPPRYGGNQNPMFGQGPSVLIMAPLNPTIQGQ